MTHLSFALATLTLLGAVGQALAQTQTAHPPQLDYPTEGMLPHQSEPSEVWFKCSPLDAERIRCEFTQFEAYGMRVAWTADQDLRAFELDPPSAEDCAGARAKLAGVPRTQTPEPSSDPNQREGLEAVVKYCETGRTEALRAFYARQHDRWQKTCTISVHHYTQTLRRVSSSPRRWATERPPQGKCRYHQFAEFHEQPDGLRYVVAFEVLDKSARDGLIGCHEARELEAIFGGSRNDAASRITCETIHYAPGCSSPEFACLGGPPMIVQ